MARGKVYDVIYITILQLVAFGLRFAQFVRTHERALANAPHLRRRTPNAAHTHATAPPVVASTSLVSSALTAARSLGSFAFVSHDVKKAKLTLTPHHLYYLLSRFEEIDASIGPMNVRMENLHAEASPANYVSFLSQSQRSYRRSDRDSIHSMTSVRSVISGISALWSGFATSKINAKGEKAQAQLIVDLKYLYAAFTKIPCLQISPDAAANMVRDYEEFPFDTAVPLIAFKNLSALEICDLDFRQLYGYDRLAEQLQSLTLKRAHISDPADLLTGIVLDDIDKRRRRSSKVQSSATLVGPPNPFLRCAEINKRIALPDSAGHEDRRASGINPHIEDLPTTREQSSSPRRPTSSKQNNTSSRHIRRNSAVLKRSNSASSESSSQSYHLPTRLPKTGSSSSLLLAKLLPSSKWRFLRHLSLVDNGLTTIPAGSLGPLANSLQSLDLSTNLFTEIPDGVADLVVLRFLNLSNCMIKGLHSLIKNPLPAITSLNLRANRLKTIAGVERLLSLDQLDLRENRLVDPTEIARLTGLPEFCKVWVQHNPLVKIHPNYRVTIFNLFRSTPGLFVDVVIDGSGPTHYERKHLIDRILENEPASVVRALPAETQAKPSIVHGTRNDLKALGKDSVDSQQQGGSFQGLYVDDGLSQVASGDTSDSAAENFRRARSGIRKQRRVDLGVEGEMPRKPATAVVGSIPLEEGLKPPSSGSVDAANLSIANVSSNGTNSSYQSDLFFPVSAGNGANGVSMQRRTSLPQDVKRSIDAQSGPIVQQRSQSYQRQVEAMKHEVGGHWLSALNEEGWMRTGHMDAKGLNAKAAHRATADFPLLYAQKSGLT
ncbi:MAG: hypothetical protein Q9220_001449 [cf. Caloplaca sp. 1 TL-2023]